MKIVADLHTHTVASTHAYSTILENSVCAKEQGLTALAMTDHAPTMLDAPHVWHFDAMVLLPRYLNDVMIIRGAEANCIDINGTIDLSPYTLSKLEWIVGSLHGPCITPGTVEENTQTYINLAKNPAVDVIGHATTAEYKWDFEEGLRAIRDTGTFMELNENSINGQYAYEHAKKMLDICRRYEIGICIDTDSHFCQKIGKIPNSTRLLEEISFPSELVVNADWEKLKGHILSKHPDALK